MTRQLDVLFINPNSSKLVYQDLAQDVSAIEVPVWSLLLAQSCRSVGFGVDILDADAERLTVKQVAQRVKDMKPRLACFVVYGQNPNSGTTNMAGAIKEAQTIKDYNFSQKICFVGSHTSALPLEVLKLESVDFVLLNEGVYALRRLLATDLVNDLQYVKGVGWKERLIGFDHHHDELHLNEPQGIVPQEKMDHDLPGYAWDLLPKHSKPLDMYRAHIWHAEYQHKYRTPFAALYTSLGCKFKCLTGDTPINTIHGLIPIKDLVGQESVPVYTYDDTTDEVKIVPAINICKTGEQQQIVRVHFDDNTWIDCTPEHKLLVLKHGNRIDQTRTIPTEARFIKIGSSVKALRHEIDVNGYVITTWSRRKRKPQHRLVMEHVLNRAIGRKEHIHHIDGNKQNNTVSNLQHYASAKEHFAQHPEISERMRINNPAKNMTPEWRAKLTKAVTGLKRSQESRLRYSESKKGTKNPNYKDGSTCNRGPSRLTKEINHKVVDVQYLPEPQDVYCMTVPNYGWFFANDVLVKNCDFCMINSINRTDNSPNITAADSNVMRFWSPEFIIQEFDKLVAMGVHTIRISDEMFSLNKKYFEPLLKLIVERGYGDFIKTWVYSRVDTVQPKYLELFQKAGIKWLALGIEAASQKIRQEITKGKFKEVDIREVVKTIHEFGMDVGANYIFGFPNETIDDLQQTLDLAIELNTANANMYNAAALPGSPLYFQAKQLGWDLPDTFEGYGFLSYDFLPLRTNYMTAAEVLDFRDKAWHKYFERPEFLSMIESKFGQDAAENIRKVSKIRLKRKILGHNP